jgi:hypothetical protein
VTSVVWTGDAAEARLLQGDGWVDGVDRGDSRDGSGGPVLRGLVNGSVAYPGDVIVKHEDGSREVHDFEQFNEEFKTGGKDTVLTDEEEPIVLDSPIPTGYDPNAVNLDVDQEEVNNLIREDDLRTLAAHADDGDEGSEDTLSAILKDAGWDPDSDESGTWAEMVQKVIESGIKVERPEQPDSEEESGDEEVEHEDDEDIVEEEDESEDEDEEDE